LVDASLLVVGAYRHTEVDDRHPLTPVLAELDRQRLASSIMLRPFEREEAAAPQRRCWQMPRGVVDALSCRGGNPSFQRSWCETSRSMALHLLTPGRVDDWAIPVGVRHVIGRRLARLG
jgi:hypothetical protein